jgi:hypothetical protein
MNVELLSKELPPHIEELRLAAAELHGETMRFAIDEPPLPENTTFAVGPNGETMFTYHHEGSNVTTNTLSIYGNDSESLTVVYTQQRSLDRWKQSGVVSRRVVTYPLGEDSLPSQVVHTGRLDKNFNFTRESAEDPRLLSDYDGETARGLCGGIVKILEVSRTEPQTNKPRGIKRVLSAMGVKLN